MPEQVLVSEIEIIADGGRRCRWTAAGKRRIVDGTPDGRARLVVVAPRTGGAPNRLSRWRRLMPERVSIAVAQDDAAPRNRVVRQMEERIRDRERQRGRRTLEAGGQDPARGLGHVTVKNPTWHARSPLTGGSR